MKSLDQTSELTNENAQTNFNAGEEDDEFDCGASDIASLSTSMPNNDVDSEDEEVIAGAESTAVFRLKLLLLVILIGSTITVSFAVHKYVKGSETHSFEENYNDDAAKVFEAVGSSMTRSLGAVDSFIVNTAAFATYSNLTWPFVTIPKYGVSISKIRGLANAFTAGEFLKVTAEQRVEWERYSTDNEGWVAESMEIQKSDETFQGLQVDEYSTFGLIHGNQGPSEGTGPFFPQWQNAPVVPIYAPYNYDGATHPPLFQALPQLEKRRVVIGSVSNIPGLPGNTPETIAIKNDWAKGFIHEDLDESEPFSELYYPIIDSASDSVRIDDESEGNFVGAFYMAFFWRDIIRDILPPGSDGLVVVFENQCEQTFTYQINGPDVIYLGPSDLHDTKYNYLEHSSQINNLEAFSLGSSAHYTGLLITNELCSYTLRVYPSDEMFDDYSTSNPLIYSMMAVFIFFFTSIVFLVYDYLVERRQDKVMTTAARTDAIVKSLFPSNVRDRLFRVDPNGAQGTDIFSTKDRLKSFMSDWKPTMKPGQQQENNTPIADLFPETTVLFADIAGFTAWSSMRQPTQVFTLLETVYGAFDYIAAKRGVFKVETIGDCYMAVVGLPERREDHAVVMAKFAFECRSKMAELTVEMVKTLGPGTGDLQFRFGLHSGPVTAGVLRGQKSRFQLFGDTVNTASRMESTCIRDHIQVSQVTASLLKAAGKDHWLKPREEKVEAKGKGKMQTYWLEPRGPSKTRTQSETIEQPYELDKKTDWFVDWYVEVFAKLIRQIVARHNALKAKKATNLEADSNRARAGGVVGLDEVMETIEMTEFDAKACSIHEDTIELNPQVLGQLRDYVMAIATRYPDNPFHNFEHACHVGMSVVKLLVRIVGEDQDLGQQWKHVASSLHESSCGIATDPLTQFACVFSALIHDADHPGVSNSQLVKEHAEIAVLYKGKSVAEQNSLNLCWKLLNGPAYEELRSAICPTEEAFVRFRQLVVNSVMATDILDKDLKNLRNVRWDRVFHDDGEKSILSKKHARDQMNRKATIVIEHLIQASDVAHTMQHWHIYLKWNERFFFECYNGYLCGRAEKNPADNWYEGELGFFDFYIIPLAKKLKDCGVFGVSSDEYLDYAEANRREWELKGRDVVAGYISRASIKG